MASSAQDDKQRQILIFQPHRLGGGIGALVHGDRLLSKLVLHEHDGGKRDGQQVWMDAGNVKTSFGKGGVNSLRAGGRNM